jgi:hypothetical protein
MSQTRFSSLPPPEISESQTEASHPLPLASDLLSAFQSLIVDYNLQKVAPIGIFVIGCVLRTWLSFWFGNDAFMVTVLIGGLTWYISSGVTKESESKTLFFREQAKDIARQLGSTKKDLRGGSTSLSALAAQQRGAVKTHDTDEEKRRRHPELYSPMDEFDGKTFKNRHVGRKKVLYQGRIKGGGGGKSKKDE